MFRPLSLAALATALLACGDHPTPAEPAGITARTENHHSGSEADKGYIDGWYDGDAVSLRYTKGYFCSEPPLSGSVSDCEIGAAAEVAPRSGSIPAIYAIAAVGFQPDPATLSCAPGSPCLNHPLMLDVSRLGNSQATNVPGLPHSHIVDSRRGGWHQTVNIRVFSQAVWDEIVAAKSLDRVRQLQAELGTSMISADTPTNIFFFLEVQKER